jgi:hypothetical protein
MLPRVSAIEERNGEIQLSPLMATLELPAFFPSERKVKRVPSVHLLAPLPQKRGSELHLLSAQEVRSTTNLFQRELKHNANFRQAFFA